MFIGDALGLWQQAVAGSCIFYDIFGLVVFCLGIFNFVCVLSLKVCDGEFVFGYFYACLCCKLLSRLYGVMASLSCLMFSCLIVD